MQMFIISCVQTNMGLERIGLVRHNCWRLNDLTGALDAGYEADILFLDFSKAFNRVSHNCLLYKLLHYGINGPVHNWITNFLSDRHQQVILDNCYSNPCKVSSAGA